MAFRDRAPSSRGTRIFVGGLGPRVNQMDVEDLFARYGRIVRADLKSRVDGSAFAFVEYDDYRDADDAIRKLDGYTFMGGRLQVEASRPPPRTPAGPRPGQQPGGLFNRQDKRVVIEGLSERTSWQDLKDFGREAGPVAYADVFRDRGKIQGDGIGGLTGWRVIEYQSREDVRNAVRKLDGVRLQGNTVYLRPEVEEDSRNRSNSRSRSRSPPRRRDDDERRRRSDSVEDRKREREEDEKARSSSPPVRPHDDSPRDRSRSPVRAASKSPSRSPSRSP